MSRRMDRVNELLREEISKLLIRDTKDPRLHVLLTITQVDASPDLHSAKVFTSVMGTQTEKEEALRGLNSAAAFLRRGLRQRLSLRDIPHLRFILDDSIEHGDHLLDLMRHLSSPERPLP